MHLKRERYTVLRSDFNVPKPLALSWSGGERHRLTYQLVSYFWNVITFVILYTDCLYFLTRMHCSKESLLVYFSFHLCSPYWKQEGTKKQIHLLKFVLAADHELLTYYILDTVEIILVTCCMALWLFLGEKWTNRNNYFPKKDIHRNGEREGKKRHLPKQCPFKKTTVSFLKDTEFT